MHAEEDGLERDCQEKTANSFHPYLQPRIPASKEVRVK